MNNGGLVRSIFIWDNVNNFAEVGWLWYDDVHSSPRRFWFRADAGQLGGDQNDGDGGDRGNFYDWRVDNDRGHHFEAFREGTKYHEYTFDNLDGGRVYANSEVDNACDSAMAEFKDFSDKETNEAPYGPWVDTRRADAFVDSPYFVRCLLSDTAFDVRHENC